MRHRADGIRRLQGVVRRLQQDVPQLEDGILQLRDAAMQLAPSRSVRMTPRRICRTAYDAPF
ncbi:MAG: hypothetical protein ACLGI9_04270 [Thermoanaerobaculia bacterium]